MECIGPRKKIWKIKGKPATCTTTALITLRFYYSWIGRVSSVFFSFCILTRYPKHKHLINIFKVCEWNQKRYSKQFIKIVRFKCGPVVKIFMFFLFIAFTITNKREWKNLNKMFIKRLLTYWSFSFLFCAESPYSQISNNYSRCYCFCPHYASICFARFQ